MLRDHSSASGSVARCVKVDSRPTGSSSSVELEERPFRFVPYLRHQCESTLEVAAVAYRCLNLKLSPRAISVARSVTNGFRQTRVHEGSPWRDMELAGDDQACMAVDATPSYHQPSNQRGSTKTAMVFLAPNLTAEVMFNRNAV